MDTLRFITCGSVNDGKSTLIERLLYESRSNFDGLLAVSTKDSVQSVAHDAEIDLASCVDGLEAEREQGIPIDVAYRFFETDTRRFVVADTYGHDQYTPHLDTGAWTTSLAVILIDARNGVLVQTRRHSRILAMMGIKHVVLAVNKMDLVEFSQHAFEAIKSDYSSFASGFGFSTLQVIPLSGLAGDNVVKSSIRMPWYEGPTLLQHLNGIDIGDSQPQGQFRMPVQSVNRLSLGTQGVCGRIATGTIAAGDRIRVLPSGSQSTIESMIQGLDDVVQAQAGDSATLTLSSEVDVCRGDVLVAAGAPPEVADQFESKLLWMGAQPLLPGRQYLMKLACKEVTVVITDIKHRVDVNTGAHLAAKVLELNDIGVVSLSTSAPLVFEPYAVNRTLGGFVVVDKLSLATVGAGMIDFALRRASNIHWQTFEVTKSTRAALKQQTPKCIWFTGLSGSGKSTIANLLEKRLYADGRHTYMLDGDNVRHGLNRNLGFTDADRVENIRRVAEAARLMVDAGLIVIVSLISPFSADRAMARGLFSESEFVEVYVDTPLTECERRDVKGLYAKARRGDLKNFTGIDSPYEAPTDADVHLYPTRQSPEQCVAQLLSRLGYAPDTTPQH